MGRKRILYLMHVDWYSIKQRPQFLAEALSDYHDLFVAYGTGRFWSRQQCQVNDHLVLFPVGELPLRRKNRMAFRLDRFFCRIQLRRLIGRLKPDLIWVSFPNQFSCIRASFAGPVVYDCMDAAPEFSLNQWHRNEITAAEESLLQCATQVFASSRRLLRIAQARAARGIEVSLLRNCYGGQLLSREQAAAAERNYPATREEPLRICYFGTIASWIDISLLIGALNEFPELEFHLLGPAGHEKNDRRHERLLFHGPVEHERLPIAARCYDCFVMPFRVNDLTLGVDPVKLYEYVNFGKPIISVYYPEIEQFRPFVDFYESEQEFRALIGQMIRRGPRRVYGEDARVAFLGKNSWPERAKAVAKKLSGVFGENPGAARGCAREL